MYVKRYEQLTREELSKNLDEKDTLIARFKESISGYDAQVRALNVRNQDLHDRIGDLEADLALEKEQRELKAKVRELEKIKRDLADKSKLNDALKAAVDKLNERMQQYEIAKSGATEDQKMTKITDDLKKKEHDQELTKARTKLTMAE